MNCARAVAKWWGSAIRSIVASRPTASGRRTGPGGSRAGCPPRERDRDGERQERGQCGQPAPLLLHLPDRPGDAGQAHRHLVAESIEGVVGPGEGTGAIGRARPLRELRGDQPAHERRVGVYLVGVHLPGGMGNSSIRRELVARHGQRGVDSRRARRPGGAR
jgi:hypothetical protein